MVRFLKFNPVDQINQSIEKKVRTIIWVVAAFTILPSTFLAYRFVQQEIFKQNLHRFTRYEIESKNLYVINQKIKPLAKQATLLVYGDGNNDSITAIIKKAMRKYNLDSAQIGLKFTLNNFRRTENNQTAAIVTESNDQTTLLIQKDVKIKSLENQFRKNAIKDSIFYSEFKALFGSVQEISLSRIPALIDGKSKANYVLLYIKDKRRIANYQRIDDWLRSRFNTDSVKVVIERK